MLKCQKLKKCQTKKFHIISTPKPFDKPGILPYFSLKYNPNNKAELENN